MRLDMLESYIEVHILERGYQYYEDGRLLSVDEVDEGVYQGRVQGSRAYTVRVGLQEDHVLYAHCDCPYDWGPYCKHQVAVFLFLRQRLFAEDEVAEAAASLQVGQGSRADLRLMLNRRSKEELVEFLLDVASEDAAVRQLIAVVLGDDELSLRTGAIALIRAYSGTPYQGAFSFDDARGANLVLGRARQLVQRGEMLAALELTLGVVEEMSRVLNTVSDPEGACAIVLGTALEVVSKVVQAASPNEGSIVLERLVAEAGAERYDEWPQYRLDLLEAAETQVKTPELAATLAKHLCRLVAQDSSDSSPDYGIRKQLQLMRYRQVAEFGSAGEARGFLEENRSDPALRELAIRLAMEREDYREVIGLAEEGEAAARDLLSDASLWKEYRYRALVRLGDVAGQRQLARELLLTGRFGYYQELKATYPTHEWEEVYPELLAQVKAYPPNLRDLYPRILVEEGEKTQLLAYARKHRYWFEEHFDQLLPEFEVQVCDLFTKRIQQQAARATTRREYRRVCALIGKLKRAGGPTAAVPVQEKLREKYRRRPAFVDELSRV